MSVKIYTCFEYYKRCVYSSIVYISRQSYLRIIIIELYVRAQTHTFVFPFSERWKAWEAYLVSTRRMEFIWTYASFWRCLCCWNDIQVLCPYFCLSIYLYLYCFYSFLKLVHIFSVNPHLGPLQISLGRMIIDIIKFFFIYTLVLFAFGCGMCYIT